MSQIRLKRLMAKKEVKRVLEEIVRAVDDAIAVVDLEGQLLFGEGVSESDRKYAVEVAGNAIGWVLGREKAQAIASLLSHLAHRELEKKELAWETLDKYKEINLLYQISERISANLDLSEVAELVLDEARKIIEATHGSVMLFDEQTQQLQILSCFFEEGIEPEIGFKLGEGIAGSVASTGKAEIVNDVRLDPRYVAGPNPVTSLMCAPLKTHDRVIGAINISHQELVQYTAADLKLLTALAAQAATAIENAILHENKLKEERIKSNLERYVSAQVVRAILDPKENISLQPTKKNVAVLFSDIRNFTTHCEQLPPERIVEYLNEYFTHMVDTIFRHQGTINKFVGDMIVALFGAPSQMQNPEEKAISAAISMQKCLKTIPTDWIRDNFYTGIGINSGKVIVGNIGSPQHMDYTAIGDEVNIASRLQGIAKGGQILVSRSVYDLAQDLFDFKEFGIVKVKGKNKAVEVFEVLY